MMLTLAAWVWVWGNWFSFLLSRPQGRAFSTCDFCRSIRLSPPENIRTAGYDDRLRPLSFHFYDRGNKAIAAYLNHGVIASPVVPVYSAWDLQNRTLIWQIEPTPTSPQILAFVLDNAIVCGTNSGKVVIWAPGDKEAMQVLDQKGDIIQAVASFDGRHSSIIALGSSHKGRATYISIWRANNDAKHRRIYQSIRLHVSCRSSANVAAFVPMSFVARCTIEILNATIAGLEDIAIRLS
ncbi:hypothetical protein BKA82DRAFT_4013867 [Pisolithus tinctorius]|nr:hypothetical protein BKA82DRAFT_4013867 [Pisolithus tinctorius]